MLKLLRVTLIAMVLLAPNVASSGSGHAFPAQAGESDHQLTAVPADEGCPGGDCGTACPTVSCLTGPCSIQSPGLVAEVVAIVATDQPASPDIFLPVHGQLLLPDTPPPRL
jgi:hypothetical protein